MEASNTPIVLSSSNDTTENHEEAWYKTSRTMISLLESQHQFLELLYSAVPISHKPLALVIDIDGTATMPRNRLSDPVVAVPAVLQIYKCVQVMFMTARVEYAREQSEEELAYAGYFGYDGLIMMPADISDEQSVLERNGANKDDLHGAWKESERVRLAETVQIFGVIDDVFQNLTGPTTGHKVWVRW